MIELRKPYLLFVGDISKRLHAKTAFGIRDWSRDSCIGQFRFSNAAVDLGLPDLGPEDAAAQGAGSLVIGVAPIGGQIPAAWHEGLIAAARAGLDIVSGMHMLLADIPGLGEMARASGTRLIDVRVPPRHIPVATGRKRTGRRLLTVGTDCALGKKYTALALTEALRRAGANADFRATGQTGIIIAGSGIPMDAVVSDFIAGAAEALSPDASEAHWDVIEGQGAIYHPAFAGVTLGLIHGSQPDVLVLCHEPGRDHFHSFPDFPLRSLREVADSCLDAARVTNASARLGAVSLNTSSLDDAACAEALERASAELGVPAFDPLRTSMDGAVASILGRHDARAVVMPAVHPISFGGSH
ncbi:DUF1611 domain-containing protein [Sphingomonas sp. LaA6.9]|uniref:DUF1611 domain-containing protein n=1 Tax=Sphingomonas sp. LaA6.9 TaxID=2919914 RepID=UPI001F503920|nr:DUF1611 domain-containing protein [Sphingomonas sp. LaA6.9]MCJ8156584.1 DUF1611 domain-containing protein [Sphingomonas sp. LaA6.9]